MCTKPNHRPFLIVATVAYLIVAMFYNGDRDSILFNIFTILSVPSVAMGWGIPFIGWLIKDIRT
jgi:hypothetical protein